MNIKVHPKKVKILMDLLYSEYPVIRNHPDYRIYYMFTDYPEVSEYVFVVTIQYLIHSEFSDKVNESLRTYKDMFSLTNCSILSEYDFEIIIKNELTQLQDKLRGSSFNIVFYEIW